VVVQDAEILMDLPLHVIVTATRVPEAAARYGAQAIDHGKHLVMIDKEAESVVGPILKHRADRAGVVFTTDFGDQPGVLMGLVSWARSLGFEVLCAGNVRGYRYDPETGILRKRFDRSVQVPEADRWAFARIPPGEAPRYVAVRQRVAEPFSTDEECGDPICHMVIAANGTGLLPDTPVGHRPALWWQDYPEAFCRFHNQTPEALIAEAKGATKTGAWLHGYTAEARIRQFYAHLTTPTGAGELGYEREAAKACWRRVRSFYRTHGIETEIEAIASWKAGSPLRSLRSASFEDWNWR
jgi:hypothetical protein